VYTKHSDPFVGTIPTVKSPYENFHKYYARHERRKEMRNSRYRPSGSREPGTVDVKPETRTEIYIKTARILFHASVVGTLAYFIYSSTKNPN